MHAVAQPLHRSGARELVDGIRQGALGDFHMTQASAGSESAFGPADDSAVQAIILAGTYSWSGSVFESLRPRPLLPVAQTPLIDYVLGWLKASGIDHATICANGSTAPIRGHVKDGSRFAMQVQYHEDRTPRGAAGCVKDALGTLAARTLVVADGTAIPTADLTGVLAHHRATRACLTIVAQERRNAPDGASLLQPAGIYVFERDALDVIPATNFQDIKETLIPRLYQAGKRIEVFAISNESPRVMDAASYLAANRWMVQRQVMAAESATRTGKGAVLAAPGAWVDSTARLIGPVMLGASVRVLAGATIIGPTSIGEGSTVSRNAVIARSVTWDNCTIGEGALVDNSLLADDSIVAPSGTVCNAIRIDSDPRRSRIREYVGRIRLRPSGPVVEPAWS